MAAFAVTGATSPLGSRVVSGLGGGADVVTVGSDRPPALDGARCLVSLALGPCPSPEPGGAARRLAGLRQALAAADAAGLSRVVHLSSAVVYGASPANAVPLAEDAPLRPDPSFGWAVELAEAERLVADWSDGGVGRAAAVLRPALVLAPGDATLLARALGGLAAPRAAGDTRLVQFVHLDDVAAAVVTCATSDDPVDGPLNVAPDGWLTDREAAALAGALLLPPSVPPRFVRPIRRLSWMLGVGASPPQTEAYVSHPWVVTADRLRALGWAPGHTIEEALVETTKGSVLATMPPHRRQQLLLAGTAAILTSALLALVATVRHAIRRR